MADLKSIPDKALKKIIDQGKLSALLESNEGKLYFDHSLIDPEKPQLEFKKYWYKFIQI
jgi:hypothetical protein